MHESARSAAEPFKNTTKNTTKTLELMSFAHLQNLGSTLTFSNEFSGVSRVHQKLHMACGLAHKQPQPKRIGATRVMAKTNEIPPNSFGP